MTNDECVYQSRASVNGERGSHFYTVDVKKNREYPNISQASHSSWQLGSSICATISQTKSEQGEQHEDNKRLLPHCFFR